MKKDQLKFCLYTYLTNLMYIVSIMKDKKKKSMVFCCIIIHFFVVYGSILTVWLWTGQIFLNPTSVKFVNLELWTETEQDKFSCEKGNLSLQVVISLTVLLRFAGQTQICPVKITILSDLKLGKPISEPSVIKML